MVRVWFGTDIRLINYNLVSASLRCLAWKSNHSLTVWLRYYTCIINENDQKLLKIYKLKDIKLQKVESYQTKLRENINYELWSAHDRK